MTTFQNNAPINSLQFSNQLPQCPPGYAPVAQPSYVPMPVGLPPPPHQAAPRRVGPLGSNAISQDQFDMEMSALGDPSVERFFLACLFARPSLIQDAVARVRPEHLTKASNKYLYKVMIGIAQQAEARGYFLAFNSAILLTAVESRGQDKRANFILQTDGLGRVHELEQLAKTVQVEQFEIFIDRLIELGTRREQFVNARMVMQTLTQGKTCDDIAGAISKLDAAEQSNNKLRPLSDIRIDPTVIRHGYTINIAPALSNALGGLAAGSLTIFAASTGVGKTMLAGNIALDLVSQGVPVLILDSEMSGDQILARLVAKLGNVPILSVMRGTHDTAIQQTVLDAQRHLKSLKAPIIHHEIGVPTLEKITPLVTQFARKHPRGVVILDYLKADNENPREWQAMGKIAEGLKSLANRFEIPIMAAAMLSKGAMSFSHSDYVHMGLSVIGGSSRIADNATAVILFRDVKDDELETIAVDVPGAPQIGFIAYLLKNRFGPRSANGIPFLSDKSTATFREFAWSQGTTTPTPVFEYLTRGGLQRKKTRSAFQLR